MCDQDHFEKDRQEYEALGLVTRKQFGVMLGAGVAMMLAYVCGFVAIAGLVIAGIAKLLDPHIHVYPVVIGAGFLFLGAAGIFVVVQFGLFLHTRLRAAMLRWTALGPEVRDQAPDQLKLDGQRPWR